MLTVLRKLGAVVDDTDADVYDRLTDVIDDHGGPSVVSLLSHGVVQRGAHD
jgi:hypothetical protein